MSLIHEFGIIENLENTSLIDYTPEKYHCISVNDAIIQDLLPSLSLLKTYFHSISRPELGLSYHGITILPPESLASFLDIVLSSKKYKHNIELIELSQMIIKAIRINKNMIHFGI